MGESGSRMRNFICIDEEDNTISISSSEEEEEQTSSSSLSGETSEDHSEWSSNEEGEENGEKGDEEEEEDSEGDEEEVIKDDEGDIKDLGLKNAPVDDQALYNRVIHLLKAGGDLQSLKHEDCKVYLRKHDLRLSGTKLVCIQRIQEHWR
ncbi:hypothetical protein MKX01_034311 [Papaver californicum]|nr:hypothetical protein MKX01_034311 [Papaver californicum]